VMVTSDGTLIGETGRKGDAQDAGDRLSATLKSRHYGMTITSMVSRRTLSAMRSDVRAIGFATGAGLFLAILGLLAFARRQGHDPVAEMRRALEADEFVPYYQPILDISNGRLEGAEALIRWRKADGTVVPPASFIPLLESSGLIFDVTRALMRRVCREMGPAIGRRSRFKIGFNLTARHFDDHAVVDDVRDVFTGSSISLSQVVLEVTERHPLEDLAGARSVIAALQDLGVRVAIDDVGAGHGGLSYLLKLGVDMIKIDKIFVDAIGAERHSAVIINSLVELAAACAWTSWRKVSRASSRSCICAIRASGSPRATCFRRRCPARPSCSSSMPPTRSPASTMSRRRPRTTSRRATGSPPRERPP
jgi:sensor c-di-GMP phosphodiesterase-like protein